MILNYNVAYTVGEENKKTIVNNVPQELANHQKQMELDEYFMKQVAKQENASVEHISIIWATCEPQYI